MKETTVDKREEVFIKIFYFFIVPILLLYFNIIYNGWRLILLLFVCIAIYAVVRNEKWSLKQLGMVAPDKKTLFAYLCFSIFMISALFFLVKVLGKSAPDSEWWENPSLMFLFIPISFLQEFAFRSFLFPLLEQVFSSTFLIIGVNTLLFAFLHIIYQPLGLSVSLALISGFAFAIMYHKYPNFWLISISHSILNLVAVLFGFFVIK